LGLNVRHREKLPTKGPAIIVANHNSHLDTLVLMTLLPWSLINRIHPVAAMDYFMRNRLIAWFSTKILGIIPLSRRKKEGESFDDRLAGVFQGLRDNQILILFPEGSRGEPEVLTEFKSGIAYISEKNPEVPIYPVFLHGLGKALPRGEMLLVPFFLDVFVGDLIEWEGSQEQLLVALNQRMEKLGAENNFPAWD